MITAQEVTVTRGGRDTLHAVSIEARPGEVLVLVGPNGAGKSTLLGVLAGELAPRQGQVRLDDRPLYDGPARLSARELAVRRAVLPQHASLRFDFPAIEIVMMGRAPHGPRQARSHAMRALELAGVADLASRMYATLSGGQQQRVQLARVLAQLGLERPAGHPRYLLLDEPTASLDLWSAYHLMGLAAALAANPEHDLGVVVVLHDLQLAAAFADRVAVLEHGHLVDLGTPAQVLTTARLAETFRLRALVQDHPQRAGRPMIVPLGAHTPDTPPTYREPPHA